MRRRFGTKLSGRPVTLVVGVGADYVNRVRAYAWAVVQDCHDTDGEQPPILGKSSIHSLRLWASEVQEDGAC
jgi:hypothetical protein